MSRLTRYQDVLLRNLCTSQYLDGNNPVGYLVWAWDALDGIPHEARGGVVARAVEAGLVGHYTDPHDPEENTIWITQKGFNALVKKILTL